MSVIAQPAARARPAIEASPGFDVGWSVPPLPAAVESRHLVVVRPGQDAGQRPATRIEVHTVLTAWRAAERELNDIREGTAEWQRLTAEIANLRAAYHRHFEESLQLDAYG